MSGVLLGLRHTLASKWNERRCEKTALWRILWGSAAQVSQLHGVIPGGRLRNSLKILPRHINKKHHHVSFELDSLINAFFTRFCSCLNEYQSYPVIWDGAPRLYTLCMLNILTYGTHAPLLDLNVIQWSRMRPPYSTLHVAAHATAPNNETLWRRHSGLGALVFQCELSCNYRCWRFMKSLSTGGDHSDTIIK